MCFSSCLQHFHPLAFHWLALAAMAPKASLERAPEEGDEKQNFMAAKDLEATTVWALKALCKQQAVSQVGRKAELVNRLAEKYKAAKRETEAQQEQNALARKLLCCFQVFFVVRGSWGSFYSSSVRKYTRLVRKSVRYLEPNWLQQKQTVMKCPRKWRPLKQQREEGEGEGGENKKPNKNINKQKWKYKKNQQEEHKRKRTTQHGRRNTEHRGKTQKKKNNKN